MFKDGKRRQLLRSVLIWGLGSGLLTQAIAYFGENLTFDPDALPFVLGVSTFGACLGIMRVKNRDELLD